MPDYGNEANEPMPLTLENVTLKDFDAENPSRASYNQDAATVFVQNDKLGLILLKAVLMPISLREIKHMSKPLMKRARM